jgi:hypothetical protein
MILQEKNRLSAFWMECEIANPEYEDNYFVMIHDRDSLHMDIVHCDGMNNTEPNQCPWSDFDKKYLPNSKYTENAYIKYWLQTQL